MLGLALGFVLTTPSATFCIEHIFSCPVWRVLFAHRQPLHRWDGWFRRLRLCCTPWGQGLALGGASPLKILGLLEVFHCPVVYGWNGVVLAAFVTLLAGIPARYSCCVLRRLNYVNSFWRTSAGSALASARCFLWFCITRCRVVSFHSTRF